MRKIIDGLGFYVGTIVGAGMFALPYAVSRAGIWWGSFFFLITLGLLTVFHLLFGAVIYHIPGKHRLPGYVKALIGPRASLFAALTTATGLFGALLVYGILAGIFLTNITSLFSPAHWSLLFFIGLGPLLLFRLGRIGMINFFLSLPIVVFVGVLFVKAFPLINSGYFFSIEPREWFLPYGVFLFAFAGLSAIPEMVEVMRKRNSALFREVVIGGSLLVGIIYVLFIVAVAGVAEEATPPDALSALPLFFGKPLVLFGQIVALLAVLTSYLAIGVDVRAMFYYDYRFSYVASWFLAASIPLFLFLIGFGNFIRTVEFLGAITVALSGAFVLWLGVKKDIISRAAAFGVGSVLVTGIVLFIS